MFERFDGIAGFTQRCEPLTLERACGVRCKGFEGFLRFEGFDRLERLLRCLNGLDRDPRDFTLKLRASRP